MGLNESYREIWGQILMLDPLPLVVKVFNLIVHKERQRTISSASIPYSLDPMAFSTTSSSPSQPLPLPTSPNEIDRSVLTVEF